MMCQTFCASQYTGHISCGSSLLCVSLSARRISYISCVSWFLFVKLSVCLISCGLLFLCSKLLFNSHFLWVRFCVFYFLSIPFPWGHISCGSHFIYVTLSVGHIPYLSYSVMVSVCHTCCASQSCHSHQNFKEY